jgi:hypothetical protein
MSAPTNEPRRVRARRRAPGVLVIVAPIVALLALTGSACLGLHDSTSASSGGGGATSSSSGFGGTSTVPIDEPPCGYGGCVEPDKPVCDTTTKTCVGCVGDQDCGYAPGTVCIVSAQICGCNGDAQCVGAPLGDQCLPNHTCGCTDAGACASAIGAACVAATRTCGCGDDSECDGGERCDVATGACVACLTNADCPGPDADLCAPTHACTSCLTQADCASSALGPRCGADGCGCAGDFECATSERGPRCAASFDGARTCSCSGDVDCASSAAGARCVLDGEALRCGCAATADCPAREACDATGRCVP